MIGCADYPSTRKSLASYLLHVRDSDSDGDTDWRRDGEDGYSQDLDPHFEMRLSNGQAQGEGHDALKIMKS